MKITEFTVTEKQVEALYDSYNAACKALQMSIENGYHLVSQEYQAKVNTYQEVFEILGIPCHTTSN